MIITMQGNWKILVKSKNAAYPQRFIVQGALAGNGIHLGTANSFVNVVGNQWSISIQNNPGSGWESSTTKIKFPHQNAGHYEFDILSNDAGVDTDFNDLILTCSTPVNINDFIVYGNITLYNGRCIFNPCRKLPFVIDTFEGLRSALKNPLLRDWIEKEYPERIPVVIPNPPDPAPFFKPIVFDLSGESMKTKSSLRYIAKKVEEEEKKPDKKGTAEIRSQFSIANFEMAGSSQSVLRVAPERTLEKVNLAKNIGSLILPCFTNSGANLTLTFEEYDRTASELGGGVYTGDGYRRLLGDAITDANGNYIFRFSFDMNLPGLEDSSDIAPGESVNTIVYPDIIVKIVDYSPFHVKYESAPFYNVPNLKRLDLCLPESKVHISSSCFNGNLIGSIGNVFIGGNQNINASTSDTNLRRYGNSNFLESTGIISVKSVLAGFSVECAAWNGIIDMRGCMYDIAKSSIENKIEWYTIRIMRSGTSRWNYVSQNYKHPKFSKRNLANYTGDDVGPFYPNFGGDLNGTIPSYINIQREIFVDGVDWEFTNFDRFMQLNSALYDVVAGVRTPGKFYIRVDGYDETGNHVAGATDMIALFIHNNGINFQLTSPALSDPSVENVGCGLYHLTEDQIKTPITFAFEANDPFGFIDNYSLTMQKCPDTSLRLTSNIDANFIVSGIHAFPGGSNPANIHHTCAGYTGTQDDYSSPGLVNVQIEPPLVGDGWLKPDETFSIYSFSLSANQRVTNGYNTGLSGTYVTSTQIMLEKLNDTI